MAALWRLIQDWEQAGKPKASRENTSFNRWCHTIGGIVEFSGYGCPTVLAEMGDAGDTDTRDIAKLGEAMVPDQPYGFPQLVQMAEAAGLFERFTNDCEKDGGLTRKAKSGFSRLLGGYRGRHVTKDRRFLVQGDGHQRRYLVKK